MGRVAGDLALALDRVAFARAVGVGEPDPWQRGLLRSEAPRLLLNCCRQSGKSTISAVLGLHEAVYHPGSLVLCLAPSERQSKELFSKIAAFYRVLGNAVPAGSDRKLGMEFRNGSRIEALPSTEKTVRGFSGASLLIIDEASRVADDLYFSIRPMLAVSAGRLVGLSTPWGKRGWWFEAWAGGEDWRRFEVPASECPRIPPAFLAEEQAALPTRVYRQEYECSFEETEDQVFTYEEIEGAMSDDVEPLFGEAN